MLNRLFDNTSPGSLVNKFRRKRFRLFYELIKDIPKPARILDAGGTQNFWEMMGLTDEKSVEITIVNTEETPVSLPNFCFVKTDARDLSAFSDNEFDVVFSNSVIEHVGTYREQKKMAEEIQRAGKRYFVQTPNYYFPFEPHFMFPCFQFFPQFIEVFLIRNFNLGWFKRAGTNKEAKQIIDSVNLLTASELTSMFEGGKLVRERFFFLTKSLIIVSS